MHGGLGSLSLVHVDGIGGGVAVLGGYAHILLPLASVAMTVPVGGMREVGHVVVLLRQRTDGEAVVGRVLQVLDEQVEYLGTYDGVEQQVAGALHPGPCVGTARNLGLQSHLHLIAGAVVNAVPVQVYGVTVRIACVEAAVIRVVGTLTAGIVDDEHGHKLSVGARGGAVVVVFTSNHQGRGACHEKEQ